MLSEGHVRQHSSLRMICCVLTRREQLIVAAGITLVRTLPVRVRETCRPDEMTTSPSLHAERWSLIVPAFARALKRGSESTTTAASDDIAVQQFNLGLWSIRHLDTDA